jgi:hypothetical protein
MELISDGMAFSEEIKIEAILKPEIGFQEMPIRYSNRAGAKKLNPWYDGWRNLVFLFKKRLLSRRSRIRRTLAEPESRLGTENQRLAGVSHRE